MYGAFGHVSLKSVSKFDLPKNCVLSNVSPEFPLIRI